MAEILEFKRSACGKPDVNLRNQLYAGKETQVKRHQKSKTGVSAPQKGLKSSILSKKETYLEVF